MSRTSRVGVLLSGSGRTLENFLVEQKAGRLPLEFACVVSSREDVRGVSIAREAGLPTEVRARRDFGSDEAFGQELCRTLDRARTDLVAMAGFLHLFRFDPSYRNRVLNIHPSLLPAFGGRGYYGDRVHRAVLASGASESGCTVHFADSHYDRGPIILQRRVPVLPGDDAAALAARVFEAECKAYPEALRWYAAGRLRVVDDRVEVLPGDEATAS